MGEREIAEGVKKLPYFKVVADEPMSEQNDGTRDIGELYPFLICGGTNTERYYFMHINDKTNYKFNIKPKYFGNESNYTEAFPKRIYNPQNEMFSHFGMKRYNFKNETQLFKVIPHTSKIQKNRPASPERNTFEGS